MQIYLMLPSALVAVPTNLIPGIDVFKFNPIPNVVIPDVLTDNVRVLADSIPVN
jgi:hypothetical protein